MATITAVAAARGGQRRSLPLLDDPTPQQLREWVHQRARPGGGGFGFLCTAQRRQQSQQETFSLQVLSELFPKRCVTSSVEAAALGASESAAALGASESAAALGASESTTALGARASPATGPSSVEALHTFTLDSGASRCFFRDCTSLTPLAAPVPVSLADPTGGPVVARASTVLPCPAVPSASLLRPRRLLCGPRAALPGPDPPPCGLVAHPRPSCRPYPAPLRRPSASRRPTALPPSLPAAPPPSPAALAALTCGPVALYLQPRRSLPAAPPPLPAAPPPLPAAIPAVLPAPTRCSGVPPPSPGPSRRAPGVSSAAPAIPPR
ncbi:unnamed protein product [Closterium sp. NIES-54]